MLHWLSKPLSRLRKRGLMLHRLSKPLSRKRGRGAHAALAL